MSIISDFINRIRNRNQGLLQPAQEARHMEQYDYDSVIEYMYSNGGMDEFFEELDKINAIQDKYHSSKVHGIEHTSRVTFFAMILSKLDNLEGHTKKLILAAARLHDVGRIDDRESREHGVYGKVKIENEELLEGFSKSDKDIIKFVVEQHSLSKEENELALKKLPFWKRQKYQEVLNYLKDADALDRVRIANKDMQLDPNRLRCDSAKMLVSFAYQNYQNFAQMLTKGKLDIVLSKDPELAQCYELIKDDMFSVDWILQYANFLKFMLNKQVLQDCKNEDLSFAQVLNDKNMMNAYMEVTHEDFEKLKKRGYNITYQSFLEIVGQYKPGTLEILRKSGDLSKLFSKETFEKYGREPSFEDRLKQQEISDKELYDLVNSGQSINILETAFNADYMLYKNLYQNHREGFDMWRYADGDYNIESVSGPLEKIESTDLEVLNNAGYKIALVDLITFTADMKPEEYRKVIDSGDVFKLFQWDKRPIYKEKYDRDFQKIKLELPGMPEEEFFKHYKLYEIVCDYDLADVLRKYSIKEVAPAIMRMKDAEFRLRQKDVIQITPESVTDLIEFSRKVKILESEKNAERDNTIEILSQKGELRKDPRFIAYVTKRNKVFKAQNAEDILDYNRFCMEELLENLPTSLEDAKKMLINSLINIDVADERFKDATEQNIVDELYYYKKYYENGDFESVMIPGDKREQDMVDTIGELIKAMDSQTIDDFRKNLWMLCYSRENINFDAIVNLTQDRMASLAREDLITQLQKTEETIKEAPEMEVKNGDKIIPVKYLGGQDFLIAMTTVMPFCSSVSKNKFNMEPNLIKDNMLTRPLNPDNRCTATISSKNMAHPMSALDDAELKYGYIVESPADIGVMGKTDLSTRKQDVNGKQVRVTSKPTQNRKSNDIVSTMTEEHDEVVLNNAYPRYIVCVDKISDIAIQKYEMLKEQYDREGQGRKIEIVFVDGKNKYLPRN